MGVACPRKCSGCVRSSALLHEGTQGTSMDELVTSLETSSKNQLIRTIRLSDVTLTGRTLRHYTAGLKANPRVAELSFSACEFQSAELGIPRKLERLEMTSCSLTDLPPAFKCKNLIVVDLSNNEFTSIPAALQLSKPLQRLSLEKNQLKTVETTEFSTFFQLRELNLSGNQIKEVNLDFKILRWLEILLLTENQVSVLPPVFFPPHNSRLLDLRAEESCVLRHAKPSRFGEASRRPRTLSRVRTQAIGALAQGSYQLSYPSARSNLSSCS